MVTMRGRQARLPRAAAHDGEGSKRDHFKQPRVMVVEASSRAHDERIDGMTTMTTTRNREWGSQNHSR